MQAAELFTTLPIAEIRAREQHASSEVAAKSAELKETVGARYRDLIASADSMVSMRTSCHTMVEAVCRMQEQCAQLQQGGGAGSVAQLLARCVVGRAAEGEAAAQVKFVAGTPPQVWAAIDGHRYFHAALRLLSARASHDKLLRGDAAQLAKFPWLSALRDSMGSFDREIAECGRRRLRCPGLSAEECADTLVALRLLDRSSSEKSLELLLSSCTGWVRACLSATPSAFAELQQQMEELSRLVALTLATARAIFEVQPSGEGRGLLAARCESAAATLGPGAAVELPDSPMTDAIRTQCSAWVADCESLLRQQGGLLDATRSIAQLQSLAAASTPCLDAAVSSVAPGASWDTVCAATLDSATASNTWSRIFQPSFLARASTLVANSVNLDEFDRRVKEWVARPRSDSHKSSGALTWQIKPQTARTASAEGNPCASIIGLPEIAIALSVDFAAQMTGAASGSDEAAPTDGALDLDGVLSEASRLSVNSWCAHIASHLDELSASFDAGQSASWIAMEARMTQAPMAQLVDLAMLLSGMATCLQPHVSGSHAAAAMQTELRETSVKAHSAWSTLFAQQAGALLQSQLAAELLSPDRGWRKASVAVSSDEGLEDSFLLPAAASPACFAFLHSLCTRLHLAGGPSLHSDVLTRTVSSAAARAQQAFGQREMEQGGASENTILQLLFDVRFASLVLRRGIEHGGDDALRWSQLERRLSRHIDPIDWDTYKQFLWDYAQQHSEQCALTFGLLRDGSHQGGSRDALWSTGRHEPNNNTVPLASSATQSRLMRFGTLAVPTAPEAAEEAEPEPERETAAPQRERGSTWGGFFG